MIVWDLDGTLGEFEALARARDAMQEVTVHLRPGVDEALARLSREGFAHVLLTMATPAYAELALAGTGLRHHFVEVAGAGQRPKGDAEGLARAHGIPIDVAHDRMLFVGDHPLHDAPSDERVCFHVEPKALRRSAAPLAELILALRARGDGSLRRGFDVLASPPDAGGDHATRDLPGIGPVVFVPRADGCPVFAFATAPEGDAPATAVTFRRGEPPAQAPRAT